MFPIDAYRSVALYPVINMRSGRNAMRLRESLPSQSKKKVYDQGDIMKALQKVGLFNTDIERTIAEYTTNNAPQKKNSSCCIIL
jgi:hypothetical protein